MKKIGNRLSFMVCGCIFMVLVITLVTVLFAVNSSFSKMYQDYCESSMTVLKNYVKEYHENLLTQAKKLSEEVSDSESAKKIIDSAAISADKYESIAVFSSDGGVVSSYGTGVSNAEFNSTALWRNAVKGKSVSDVYAIGDQLYFGACSAAADGMSVCIVYALNNYALLDNLKEYAQSEFTLFLGKTRFSTTLVVDNERQVGTDMNADVEQDVLVDEKNHMAEISLFGDTYMAYYQPLVNNEGEILGAYFTGENIQTNIACKLQIIITMVIAGVILMILSCVIFLRYITKKISRPMTNIVAFADELNSGNIGLNQHLVADRKNADMEIATLFNSVEGVQKSVSCYIGEISKVLNAIANGNLTISLKEDYKGDFVEIQTSLNKILAALNNSMASINKASGLVSQNANTVNQSSQTLSEASTKQASTIEELSSVIADIAATTKKNAIDAREVSTATFKTGENIEASNQRMQNLLTAIEEINASSGEIEKINKTIEDIAFQTNILALNAAVEAARAGEAGKGFAVVADEVRNLAGKSAIAAQNTTKLIQKSIQSIQDGSKIASETAIALDNVVEETKHVVEKINVISNATEGQAAAIAQVADAVEQISSTVYENSASAEESAQISQALNQQSDILKSAVQQFRLK